MSLIAFFTGNKWGRYLVIALLIAGLVGVAVARIYAAGSKDEKLKQLNRKIKVLQIGINNDSDINGMSNGERAERLRRYWTK